MATLFEEEWVLGPDKIRFYTRKYEPPEGIAHAKAAVLFLHGFVEHIARYSHVFPVWAQRGIAVLAFDQRGFGRTSEGDGEHKGTGRTNTTTEDAMDDIEWFVRRLGEWATGGKLFLVGHSMGGFNAINFLCSPQSRSATLPKLSGAVALSPLMGLTHPPPKLQRTLLTVISYVLPSMTTHVAVDPAHLSRDPEVCKSYKEDPLVFQKGTLKGLRTMLDAVDLLQRSGYHAYPSALPVLWVHGTADSVNSFAHSQGLFEKIKAKRKTFTAYEGGFHELLNEPHPMKERLMDEVAGWVLELCGNAEPAPGNVTAAGEGTASRDGTKARL